MTADLLTAIVRGACIAPRTPLIAAKNLLNRWKILGLAKWTTAYTSCEGTDGPCIVETKVEKLCEFSLSNYALA